MTSSRRGSATPPADRGSAATQQATEAAPGGLLLDLAKRGAEQLLWTRVGVQRRVVRRPPSPNAQLPTAVLDSDADWRAAVREARRLRLPLHHDRPKNWDALGALSVVLENTTPDDGVVDAGSARYSSLLPWLRLYGYRRLTGLNLEFGEPVRRQGVVFRYGDVTDTRLAAGSMGAVTCLSVIEHGVPIGPFLRETARILRPGGVLALSTDYDADPPETTGKLAYGQPVHIFGPDEIAALIEQAGQLGLDLLGEFRPAHAQRPVHWKRQDLDYTFVRLSFTRR